MLGSTKLYGCIADPINHVKAPTIFTSIFKKKNIDAVLVPIHTNEDDLEYVINSLKLVKNFKGMTVTIPHKKAAAKLCDYLEPDAEFTESVNWIKFDEKRKLIGNNFDGKGFITGFKSRNFLLKNKNICIFGSGGAAVSIACSIAQEDINSLKIINRDHSKANNLLKKIKVISNDLKVEALNSKDNFAISEVDIIINATSLGLSKNDELPFDVTKSSPETIIADIIMEPEETELLKRAKKLGRSIHYGKYMLESQIDLAGNFLDLW